MLFTTIYSFTLSDNVLCRGSEQVQQGEVVKSAARRRELMAAESSLYNNNITHEPGQRALGIGMVLLSLGNHNEVMHGDLVHLLARFSRHRKKGKS